jgi:hypothetical protein
LANNNRGSRFRPAVSLDPFSCRSSMAPIPPTWSSRDQRPQASSEGRHHQLGTPVSSLRHRLGEPVGFIVIASIALENVSRFVPTRYDDKIDGRHGQIKQVKCIGKDVRTIRVTALFVTARIRRSLVSARSVRLGRREKIAGVPGALCHVCRANRLGRRSRRAGRYWRAGTKVATMGEEVGG